jgi:hypothetical protein
MTHQRTERQPYGWVIEFSEGRNGRPRVSFLLHDERIDYAAALQRAVDLRGELVPVIADRRRSVPHLEKRTQE